MPSNTPFEDFRAEARELMNDDHEWDPEADHSALDRLMEDALRSIAEDTEDGDNIAKVYLVRELLDVVKARDLTRWYA